MANQKLSVFLGLRDKLEKTFKNMLTDMHSKFKKNQGLFKGHRKTFAAYDGYVDDPTKRNFKKVSSTVGEQLKYFKENTSEYFKITLSIEKTNAQGIKAPLIVSGETIGEYTTLELLRTKSILESKFREMLQELPVRPEDQIWVESDDANYKGKSIFESPMETGETKTTIKEDYIIPDPHIKDSPNRTPQVAQKTTQVNTGKYTSQEFSGELSIAERANFLRKYDAWHTGIIQALETANNVETVESDLGEKLLEDFFGK